MERARLNYLELPVEDTARAKRFYAQAFGLAFEDYGPSYAATATDDVDIGFQADRAEATTRPLPILEVSDLERVRDGVQAAGGTITRDIFAFPGGRRFHFLDPDGHELAVWTRA